MGDSGDEHETFVVVDGVHDSEVADSNAIIAATGKLDCTGGTRVDAKRVNCCRDASQEWIVKTTKRASRLRMQPELVAACRAGYARTSDQGSAASRSSRAWRAARLSSR